MTLRRRYERLQFWMQDIYGEWVSFNLKDVAPSDIDRARRFGKTEYLRSIIGVGTWKCENCCSIEAKKNPKYENYVSCSKCGSNDTVQIA